MFWTAIEVAHEMKMKKNLVHKNLIPQINTSLKNKFQAKPSQHACRSKHRGN